MTKAYRYWQDFCGKFEVLQTQQQYLSWINCTSLTFSNQEELSMWKHKWHDYCRFRMNILEKELLECLTRNEMNNIDILLNCMKYPRNGIGLLPDQHYGGIEDANYHLYQSLCGQLSNNFSKCSLTLRYYLVWNAVLNLFYKDYDFKIKIPNDAYTADAAAGDDAVWDNLIDQIVNKIFLHNIARIGLYGDFVQDLPRPPNKQVKLNKSHNETLKKITNIVFNGDAKQLHECVEYCLKDVKSSLNLYLEKEEEEEKQKTDKQKEKEKEKETVILKFGKYGGMHFYIIHRISMLVVECVFGNRSKNSKNNDNSQQVLLFPQLQTFFELMLNFSVFFACYPIFWFYANEHDIQCLNIFICDNTLCYPKNIFMIRNYLN